MNLLSLLGHLVFEGNNARAITEENHRCKIDY